MVLVNNSAVDEYLESPLTLFPVSMSSSPTLIIGSHINYSLSIKLLSPSNFSWINVNNSSIGSTPHFLINSRLLYIFIMDSGVHGYYIPSSIYQPLLFTSIYFFVSSKFLLQHLFDPLPISTQNVCRRWPPNPKTHFLRPITIPWISGT